MIAPLLSALLAAAAPAGVAPDSGGVDSTAAPRIVREFEPLTVLGDRFSDTRSIETVQHVPATSLRRLPVDRLVDAVGLRAGVVVGAEGLHVRGGRAGELVTTIAGVPLNETRRGSAMEVPLLAVRSADLLTGGLDADHAGSLAGVLALETESPGRRPAAMLRWLGDGLLDTGYDAGHARLSVPVPGTGLGIALAGEARLDDLGLPSTRSRGRRKILGASFGWRQDNRLLAWGKIAPVAAPGRASVEVLASRTVRQPYNPMFDFDGWVSFEGFALQTADRQLDRSYFRYRAGDHAVMTEERRLAVIGAAMTGSDRTPVRLALGWAGETALTSVGLRRDPGYIYPSNRPVFGPYDYPLADPFHTYYGDEPYFRDAGSERWFARADAARRIGLRHRVRFGAGATYEHVRMVEVDDADPEIPTVTKRRTYNAWAPGTYAYAQHRWDYGGLVWSAGLRLSSWTAGPQADGPFRLPFQGPGPPWKAPTFWSWSPRLGFAYPISTRDVFSLSYSRITQDPPRDLLYENRWLNYDRHPLGNGQLEPATLITYQMALKHVLDPLWSLQLGAFYRDLYGQPGTRMIEPMQNYYLLRYASADDGHASGIEVTLTREWPGHHRFELAYTYMEAWGTQSNLEGLAYGTNRGERPVPTGTHPLDWDQRHAVSAAMVLEVGRDWVLSWSTRAASGLPWTPLHRTPGLPDEWPSVYADQSLLNSRRLPWSENTNMALRFRPPVFFGFAAMLTVTNLFENRTDRLATLSGFPNPRINTLYDQYSAFRTETGLGGLLTPFLGIKLIDLVVQALRLA